MKKLHLFSLLLSLSFYASSQDFYELLIKENGRPIKFNGVEISAPYKVIGDGTKLVLLDEGGTLPYCNYLFASDKLDMTIKTYNGKKTDKRVNEPEVIFENSDDFLKVLKESGCSVGGDICISTDMPSASASISCNGVTMSLKVSDKISLTGSRGRTLVIDN